MNFKSNGPGDRSAWPLVVVLAVGIAGCGGHPPAPAGTGGGATAKVSAPPAAAPQKTASKGGRKKIKSDEDERGIQERRVQGRLKDGAKNN